MLVPPDLSGSGRQYLLDRYYELIVSKEMRDKENVVQTCDAVLLHGESLSSKVLQNAGNRLKAISASRTMQDQADLLCASRLGIWVVDVDAVSYLSRAEYEIALLLSCCKQITRMDFLAHSQNERISGRITAQSCMESGSALLVGTKWHFWLHRSVDWHLIWNAVAIWMMMGKLSSPQCGIASRSRSCLWFQILFVYTRLVCLNWA